MCACVCFLVCYLVVCCLVLCGDYFHSFLEKKYSQDSDNGLVFVLVLVRVRVRGRECVCVPCPGVCAYLIPCISMINSPWGRYTMLRNDFVFPPIWRGSFPRATLLHLLHE